MHEIQLQIIKQLALNSTLRFRDLIKEIDITSEHFTYHINSLIKKGYIEKIENTYTLTLDGKVFVNKYWVNDMKGYQGPFVSVLLFITQDIEGNRKEILLSKRLRHPHFGLFVNLTGKVLFGERFEDTASRVLLSETGLKGEFEYLKVYRKLSHKNNKIVQDVIFIEMICHNPKGKLKEKTSRSENIWIHLDEIEKQPNLISDFIERIDDIRQRKMEIIENPIDEEVF